jgi:hypothetical protein
MLNHGLIKITYNDENNKYYQNFVRSFNDNFDQLKDRFIIVKLVKNINVNFKFELFNFDNKKYLDQDYFLSFVTIFGIIDKMASKRQLYDLK